jgi:cell division protein FtsL
MSTTIASVVIALIVGLPSIIAAIAAYRAAVRTEKTGAKVDEVAHRIDGRMDEILELSKRLAHSAGVTEGTAIGKADAEQAARDKA